MSRKRLHYGVSSQIWLTLFLARHLVFNQTRESATQMTEKLIYTHERPLFIISIIISLLVWLTVFISTFGVILLFIFIGFLFYFFMQSAFISFIKGNAIKITEEQLPDLYKQYLSCCDKLGIKRSPEIYMMHGDGFIYSFATRYLGRNFVILLSDVVDALKDEKGCLNFYLGHELGHIHRKHHIWKSFLIPSSILPLLGPAYSRAREITCNNYGLSCCEDSHESMP
jgi:Zn-dependent protease with chaperone function